jgi:hypothetical protein
MRCFPPVILSRRSPSQPVPGSARAQLKKLWAVTWRAREHENAWWAAARFARARFVFVSFQAVLHGRG